MNKFSENKTLQELLKISNELSDLGGIFSLLSWDQEVMMPPKGAINRANQLATLSGIHHDKITSLDPRLLGDDSTNELDKALVREVRREYEKSVKLPKELVQEISMATSRAYESWCKAKKENNFSIYENDLQNVLNLKIKVAKILQEKGQSLYDVMLDDYEQGLTEVEIDRVFSEVKPKLIELVKKIKGKTAGWGNDPIDIHKTDWQEFAKKTVTDMGYDWEAGRLDTTAHPFETTIGSGDVRITTWREGKDWKEMLMASMHETGHALYEQGVDENLARTHLGGGQGLVLHESQSRLWENMVGRSRAFWSNRPEEYFRALNVVRPSPVRVLADEVTYGLHIILRFEIERELVSGKIDVGDLPKIWNEKMQEYLGIIPKNDAEGVLQDVHWAHGSFGYFPTYFLGTMVSAQLFKIVNDQIPNLNTQIEKHEFGELREWLREKIHTHGKVYLGKDLVKKVTGENLNPKYFLEYLENKFVI